jgi:FAD synthase
VRILKAKVKKGDGIGKTLDSPTANLNISVVDTGLAEGVYAVWAMLNNKKYPGALVILPKVDKVEVRLIGYGGDDFYGEEISVEVAEKVSEIIDVEMGEDLKRKIEEDMERVRKILKK